MVADACNPSYSGGRDRKIVAQGQLRQKLVRLSLKTKTKPKNRALWYTPVVPITQEVEGQDHGSRPI
jgi:hypothetical protein